MGLWHRRTGKSGPHNRIVRPSCAWHTWCENNNVHDKQIVPCISHRWHTNVWNKRPHVLELVPYIVLDPNGNNGLDIPNSNWNRWTLCNDAVDKTTVWSFPRGWCIAYTCTGEVSRSSWMFRICLQHTIQHAQVSSRLANQIIAE